MLQLTSSSAVSIKFKENQEFLNLTQDQVRMFPVVDRREERVTCIELIANMRRGWIRSAAGDLSCHPVIRTHALTCSQQYCPHTAHHGPQLSIVCTSGYNANFYDHTLIIQHTVYNLVTCYSRKRMFRSRGQARPGHAATHAATCDVLTLRDTT